MRAIVHLVKRDASPQRRVGYLANKAVLVGDWIGNDIAFNAEALLFDHHGGRGRKTRHVILSLERDADMGDERLTEVAENFMFTFAPSSAWLGAIDRNTRATHVHIVLSNSDGERTLNFSPAVLTRMQDVAAWSNGILQAGKRGAVLSKLSTAQQLETMTHEEIQDAVRRGEIQVGRCNRRGEITSVIFQGRRVRLSTVQRVAAAAVERDPANRGYDHSEVRLDGSVDRRRNRRQDAARRGAGRSAGRGTLGAPHAREQGQQASAQPQARGEPSELFPARPSPVQGPSAQPGDSRVARTPQMGGPVR